MADILTAPMLDHLHTALAERYRLERELGRGGMATSDIVSSRRATPR